MKFILTFLLVCVPSFGAIYTPLFNSTNFTVTAGSSGSISNVNVGTNVLTRTGFATNVSSGQFANSLPLTIKTGAGVTNLVNNAALTIQTVDFGFGVGGSAMQISPTLGGQSSWMLYAWNGVDLAYTNLLLNPFGARVGIALGNSVIQPQHTLHVGGSGMFNGALTASNGLTLISTLTASNASVGTSGQVLTSGGAGNTPSWTTITTSGLGTLTGHGNPNGIVNGVDGQIFVDVDTKIIYIGSGGMIWN